MGGMRKITVLSCFSILLLGLILAYTWKRPRTYSMEEIREWIRIASDTYEVDEALVSAVIWKESRYFAGARGAAGEIGLMQLRQLAASEWAEAENISPFEHEHVLHPSTNTLAGTWYLKKMLDRYADFDEPIVYALADYNAGRKNVLRWLEMSPVQSSAGFLQIMDFPTTRQYIFDVRQKYHELNSTPPDPDHSKD